MALGAPRLAVLRLIVGEGMTVGLIGIGAGLLAAFALSRALASLVFAVPVHDPATFAASAQSNVTPHLIAMGSPRFQRRNVVRRP